MKFTWRGFAKVFFTVILMIWGIWLGGYLAISFISWKLDLAVFYSPEIWTAWRGSIIVSLILSIADVFLEGLSND